ncbi:MAG: hypothetical protein ACRD3O_10105, partial [Terriglobia bacterium]
MKPNLRVRLRARDLVRRIEGSAGATRSPQPAGRLPGALIIAALCLCLARGVAPALAAGSESGAAPVDVQRLMRNVAWNELHARKDPAHQYEYDFREETPQASKTFLQIKTRQGMVERLINVNGQPPGETRCHKNLNLLNRIASQPQLQQSRLRSQRADMARREQLFAAMPAAFLFRIEG